MDNSEISHLDLRIPEGEGAGPEVRHRYTAIAYDPGYRITLRISGEIIGPEVLTNPQNSLGPTLSDSDLRRESWIRQLLPSPGVAWWDISIYPNMTGRNRALGIYS